MTVKTHFSRETNEAPERVSRLLDQESAALKQLGVRIAALNPRVIATAARGSSDHAASFFKYTVETVLGIPVASIGPSIASIYDAPLNLAGGVLVTISQSGSSPDLLALQASARRSGALTVALVNQAQSPIAAEADVVIPLHAGPEVSIAASKSFIASLVAGAALVAAISSDEGLHRAIRTLPEHLAQALACDWSRALAHFAATPSYYTLGRGPTLAIAREAALKCKEMAARHAEAFSLAEVMHGPLRLAGQEFPMLAFVPEDRALEANRAALARLVSLGTPVFTAGPAGLPGVGLPAIRTGSGVADAICLIQSFYPFAGELARMRGLDPDQPAHLAKVTHTL